MHSTLAPQLANALSELLCEAKLDALTPITKFFVEQIESHGYSFEQILQTLSFLAFERRMVQTGFHLEGAARKADEKILESEDQLFDNRKSEDLNNGCKRHSNHH